MAASRITTRSYHGRASACYATLVSRAFVTLLALTAASTVSAACKRSAERKVAPGPASDAPDDAAVDARSEPAPDLSFVRGTIYIAEERAGRVQPVRLDAATGGWIAHGGGPANLFPSGQMFLGGLLVIATEGESEGDHVEQLAIVRGDAVERFGPRAGAVRNPIVSADGHVVVVETSEHGFRDLYRIAPGAAGGRVVAVTRLTDNREGNFDPALSPDGTVLAFSSSRDGDAELYRAPSGGGAATRLTAFHKDDWSPLWSPAGDTLAFLSDREGPPRLFLMAPDGTAQRRATTETDPDVVEDLPRWSPAGGALLFTRSAGAILVLHVLDVPTGKVRKLTPEGVTDTDAAWSPDGVYLAVLRRALSPAQTVAAAEVTLVRAADGAVMAQLPRSGGDVRLLRWIP